MSSLEKSINRSRTTAMVVRSQVDAIREKGHQPFGMQDLTPQSGALFDSYRNQSSDRKKYAAFRGYVHSAVNALGQEGASQSVNMGRISGQEKKKSVPKKKDLDYLTSKMPGEMARKAASTEMELIDASPMLDLLNRPNGLQYKYQFVYSFIANLCLTGFSYIIAGESKQGKPELYSLPTTWVRPSHKKGPFSEFKIVDPKNPASEANAQPFDRSQVAFAMLPDPGDPLGALSPATAQASAILIDEKIQSSQVAFFDNGIFPSAVVTVGKNPHPDVPGGLRPRLTAAQRRQVYGAIKKISTGVSNYGNPAIVDGLIEKIERFSSTQNEMGWEKSEKTIRSRILSAFGVHPFILGEEMIGSYAQAYIIQERFSKKVNVFLDLLSSICTDFVPPLFGMEGENYLLWFEKMSAIDPSMRQSLWTKARENGDVTQNEFRSFMGLPPDEDSNESYIDKTSAQQVVSIASQVSSGMLDVEQGIAILEAMGLSSEIAIRIAGSGVTDREITNRIQQALDRLSPAQSENRNLVGV